MYDRDRFLVKASSKETVILKETKKVVFLSIKGMIAFSIVFTSLGLLVLWILYYMVTKGLSIHQDPLVSINQIKQFLGFDFGLEYTLLKHESNPSHGDRPLTVTLKFSENTFAEIMNFVTQIHLVETITHDQKKEIEYKEVWQKCDIRFQKHYSAKHLNGDYTFFRSCLSIDPANNTIHHHQSGY